MRRFNLKGIKGARLEFMFACLVLNLETIIRRSSRDIVAIYAQIWLLLRSLLDMRSKNLQLYSNAV